MGDDQGWDSDAADEEFKGLSEGDSDEEDSEDEEDMAAAEEEADLAALVRFRFSI